MFSLHLLLLLELVLLLLMLLLMLMLLLLLVQLVLLLLVVLMLLVGERGSLLVVVRLDLLLVLMEMVLLAGGCGCQRHGGGRGRRLGVVRVRDRGGHVVGVVVREQRLGRGRYGREVVEVVVLVRVHQRARLCGPAARHQGGGRGRHCGRLVVVVEVVGGGGGRRRRQRVGVVVRVRRGPGRERVVSVCVRVRTHRRLARAQVLQSARTLLLLLRAQLVLPVHRVGRVRARTLDPRTD